MITTKARHWTFSLFVSQALLLGAAYGADQPANEAPPPWNATAIPATSPEPAKEAADVAGATGSNMENWYRNRRQKVAQAAKPADEKGQLQASAEKGDARAQYALAMLYRNDESGQVDIKKSLAWHKRAADAGYAEAQYGLGVLYANGQDVPQDAAQAQVWFQKAADQGYESARLALLPKNDAIALAPVEVAPEPVPESVPEPAQLAEPVITPVSLSVPQAEETVDTSGGASAASLDMTGIEPEAVRQSAEGGDKQAQLMLGTMYEDGLGGLPSDLREAAYWYEQAARQDYAKAQYNLGLLYEDGRGVKQNYAQAAYWYEKAAKAGFTEAQNNLGVLYVSGNGVKKDPQRAEKLFRDAAGQGNANAKRNLGLLKGG